MRIKDILKQSNKAICGFMEREVTVPTSRVSSTINKLKKEGFVIIGISYGNTKFKKIWFIRAGGF